MVRQAIRPRKETRKLAHKPQNWDADLKRQFREVTGPSSQTKEKQTSLPSQDGQDKNLVQGQSTETKEKAISWKQLLDALESKESKQADAAEIVPDLQPAPPAFAEKTQQADTRQVQVQQNRSLRETLLEEVKLLKHPVETLNWMEERIFSNNDPEALANQIGDTINPPSTGLLKLYPYLLTDLSENLRSSSPHASLLPLKLASSHSPASYLHGCTASLYASTMKTRWQIWGDIEGCLDLLEEMERGAVNHNHQIIELVSRMSDAVSADTLRARESFEPTRQKHSDNPFEAANQTIFLPEAQELKERERAIESKIFFSPAQRRALARMEELVIEHRKRFGESLKRADMLEDLIKQTKWQESENISAVNAAVESYGQQADDTRLLRSTVPHFRMSRKEPISEPFKPRDIRASAKDRPPPVPKTTNNNEEEEDMLTQAVSEVVALPPRKPRPPRKSRIKPGESRKDLSSKIAYRSQRMEQSRDSEISVS